MKRFGVSTHLYHGERLQQAHLREIASHGFESVELFATRSHFDYHDEHAILALSQWLRESQLELPSVHAPIVDSLVGDTWGRPYSTATRDEHARSATIREMQAALGIARQIPFAFLVLHLGVPQAQHPGSDDNRRDAILRSIDDIHGLAAPLGVRLALEVMDNSLSTAPALVEMLERDLDGINVGICMDVGHAHMLGDTADAIETASEYLVTTHLHDNRRQHDDHLVPFEGSIDWAATIMELEKIGYDGVLMYEVRNVESPQAVLARAVDARRRLEGLMADGSRLPAFS
ncbi:MAG: sugar phosphate isomerase/epimerase [Acidobacteria bacterium]|nr:sugar phosphate isomerase/epimerase [Acidobacteriota bacterium]